MKLDHLVLQELTDKRAVLIQERDTAKIILKSTGVPMETERWLELNRKINQYNREIAETRERLHKRITQHHQHGEPEWTSR
jgi:hypothetical protein